MVCKLPNASKMALKQMVRIYNNKNTDVPHSGYTCPEHWHKPHSCGSLYASGYGNRNSHATHDFSNNSKIGLLKINHFTNIINDKN